MGDKKRKLTNYLEENLGLFSLFIDVALGWPALFLYGSPGELDDEPSHGWIKIN